MLVYKLLRKRKDGSLGPLFIGRRLRFEPGAWHEAEDIPTKGFAHRPGFHCCLRPVAPHIKARPDRVWYTAEVEDYKHYARPTAQGGTWVLAGRMKLVDQVKTEQE